jgi:hypothetical protein
MHPERHLLLLLVAFGIMAMAQTKPGTTSASSKSATASTRVLPSIKCVDPESAVACKSFKQLVDAKDQGILFQIIGDPEDAGRHFAYVCLRPGVDTFTLVEFTVPEKKRFEHFLSDADKESRRLYADAIIGADPAHPLSLPAVNQWYEDHRDGELFAPGGVGVASYQDGQLADMDMETGEWRRSAEAVGTTYDIGYAEFVGGHYWVQAYNETHAGVSPEADDLKKMHVHVDGNSIYAHYSYENRSRETVDYTLQIHRSTGRFTETFKLPDDRSDVDVAGTCMIFKY